MSGGGLTKRVLPQLTTGYRSYSGPLPVLTTALTLSFIIWWDTDGGRDIRGEIRKWRKKTIEKSTDVLVLV